MKTARLLIVGLCASLASLTFTGCASTSNTSAGQTLNAIGPLVAEVAQARIAKGILDKNPNREASLLAVAAALDAISSNATGTEITELAIRAFVERGAEKWELTAPESELLVQGLLAAKAAYLTSTGASVIHIGDANVGPWIAAIRRGIAAGVAAHHAAQ